MSTWCAFCGAGMWMTLRGSRPNSVSVSTEALSAHSRISAERLSSPGKPSRVSKISTRGPKLLLLCRNHSLYSQASIICCSCTSNQSQRSFQHSSYGSGLVGHGFIENYTLVRGPQFLGQTRPKTCERKWQYGSSEAVRIPYVLHWSDI